jgi:uncharacterized protein YuzE
MTMARPKRHLDARGKGRYTYDFANDIACFAIQGHAYEDSVDFEDIVIDFDRDNFIIGIRVFDATTVFGVDKYALKSLKGFAMDARVESGVIAIRLSLTYTVRNQRVTHPALNLVRDAHSPIQDSQAMAST